MKPQPDIEQAASSSKRSCHAEIIRHKRFPLYRAGVLWFHASSPAQHQPARHVCQLDAARACLHSLRGSNTDHRKTNRSDSAVTQ